MSLSFSINGQPVRTALTSDTPLLWVIRDELDLKGTKYGCGIGQCGACTVHIDGVAARSVLHLLVRLRIRLLPLSKV